jgi:CRP/FNR family transcriptional regulator, transcriptional activator FtrB
MVLPGLIERYPLFSFLEPEKLKSIAEISKEESFECGVIIFHEKQRADWLYILMEGGVELFYTVEVEYCPEQRKELVCGEVCPGEVFAISALNEPHILTLTARTSKPSRMIKIDAIRLQALCEKDDQLAYGFMKQVAKATIKRLNATRMQLASVWSKTNEDEKSSEKVAI